MTEITQDAAPKRRRKPKSQSLPVMKQLVDLMEQRTVIMAKRRAAQGELLNLQMQMSELEKEIQWRANIFGMSENGQVPTVSPVATFPTGQQFDPAALTTPIFVQTQQPQSQRDGINRGLADLRSLS